MLCGRRKLPTSADNMIILFLLEKERLKGTSTKERNLKQTSMYPVASISSSISSTSASASPQFGHFAYPSSTVRV